LIGFFSASPCLRGEFGSLRVFSVVSVASVVGFAFGCGSAALWFVFDFFF